MSNSDILIDALSVSRNKRDRSTYYRTLSKAGDPYGELALGVVEQSLISGRTAKHFAEFGAACAGINLNDNLWLQISNDLMLADFDAREAQSGAKGEARHLPWNAIRDYHYAVFRKHGLPAYAWTAGIPLDLASGATYPDADNGTTTSRNANAAQLWNEMLTSGDIISVAWDSFAPERKAILFKLGLQSSTQQQRISQLPGAPTAPAFTAYTATNSAVISFYAGQSITFLIEKLSFSWKNSTAAACKQAVDIMTCTDLLNKRESSALFWMRGVTLAALPTTWDTTSPVNFFQPLNLSFGDVVDKSYRAFLLYTQRSLDPKSILK
ncbi:hypothetical protein J2D73_12385 [Acetobacter sacchari]|uniref:Uncharacterized protein n=1 Tax=Acetobacter sacchari TaxID=2661687 RepID=A0ABS3LXK9_9PROT|nr:hypothetical protein [Acetobacter sacchari]MBO1360586.1 hypothetical protein [Acetobacter sacchari]